MTTLTSETSQHNKQRISPIAFRYRGIILQFKPQMGADHLGEIGEIENEFWRQDQCQPYFLHMVTIMFKYYLQIYIIYVIRSYMVLIILLMGNTQNIRRYSHGKKTYAVQSNLWQ